MPSVETQPYGCEQQQPDERRRSRAQDHEPEQRGDDAPQGRFAGVREPAILLAERVVGHCKTKVLRHVAMFPPRLDDLAATPGLLFVAEGLHASHAIPSSHRAFRDHHHVDAEPMLNARRGPLPAAG